MPALKESVLAIVLATFEWSTSTVTREIDPRLAVLGRLLDDLDR